jgi:hypothetical protein
MLQAGRLQVRFAMRSLLNPFRRTVVLGLTQPLTEMSTRNFPGGGGATSPPLVSRLPRKCRLLDASQHYVHPGSVRIALCLLFFALYNSCTLVPPIYFEFVANLICPENCEGLSEQLLQLKRFWQLRTAQFGYRRFVHHPRSTCSTFRNSQIVPEARIRSYIYIYINKNVTVRLCVVCSKSQSSESRAPMALQFGHNVAGEYAHV